MPPFLIDSEVSWAVPCATRLHPQVEGCTVQSLIDAVQMQLLPRGETGE